MSGEGATCRGCRERAVAGDFRLVCAKWGGSGPCAEPAPLRTAEGVALLELAPAWEICIRVGFNAAVLDTAAAVAVAVAHGVDEVAAWVLMPYAAEGFARGFRRRADGGNA